MDEACNLKLQRLEIGQSEHKKEIGILFRKQTETDKALEDIKQIKWLLIGALIFFAIDKVGLLEVLKLTFK